MKTLHPLVQEQLRKLEPDELITVVVRVADMDACQAFLTEEQSRGEALSYTPAPLFDAIVLSASRHVVESLAKRKDVVAILPNLEITLPPYRRGEGQQALP